MMSAQNLNSLDPVTVGLTVRSMANSELKTQLSPCHCVSQCLNHNQHAITFVLQFAVNLELIQQPPLCCCILLHTVWTWQAHLVSICEHDASIPDPMQQTLLIAPAKQLAPIAVQLCTVQTGEGWVCLLGRAVVYEGCYVVLLQTGFTEDQHSLPAECQCTSRLNAMPASKGWVCLLGRAVVYAGCYAILR